MIAFGFPPKGSFEYSVLSYVAQVCYPEDTVCVVSAQDIADRCLIKEARAVAALTVLTKKPLLGEAPLEGIWLTTRLFAVKRIADKVFAEKH